MLRQPWASIAGDLQCFKGTKRPGKSTINRPVKRSRREFDATGRRKTHEDAGGRKRMQEEVTEQDVTRRNGRARQVRDVVRILQVSGARRYGHICTAVSRDGLANVQATPATALGNAAVT